MNTKKLSFDAIERIARNALARNGCDRANTEAIVRTIVSAERDGSNSHGLFRVPGYIAALRSGKAAGAAVPTVELATPVCIRVDGHGGFAPIALELGIPLLAQAALESGIAVLSIVNSYHLAALWPETESLAARGLIAIAAVNSKPTMAPHGGNKVLFGTNPLSFAWPRPGGEPIVFDMASAAMANGEVQLAAKEGRPVPPNTGLDSSGRDSTDPVEILQGSLLPFGGHKGSQIAMMVELLAAGATGERFGFENQQLVPDDIDPVRGGELIIALSPEVLAGKDWPAHCESFFAEYDSIEGARLPGARRHSNRTSNESREVDSELLQQIEALCQ